jgi:hypothetical protein
MMNALKGEGVVKIGGKDRVVKFGTNATALFCQIHKIGLGKFSEMFTPENLSPGVIRDLVYCALISGARRAGEPADFSLEDVGDWIDDLTEDEVMRIFEIFFAGSAQGDEGKLAS